MNYEIRESRESIYEFEPLVGINLQLRVPELKHALEHLRAPGSWSDALKKSHHARMTIAAGRAVTGDEGFNQLPSRSN
jgi:hypothetical protein